MNLQHTKTQTSEYKMTNINEIYKFDKIHCNSTKRSGKYYIGLCDNRSRDDVSLLSVSISATSFYKYTICDVLKYLYNYSLTRINNPKVDVMKLTILDDGTYSVLVKTFWIKIIQRHWRKIYNSRVLLAKQRSYGSSRNIYELTGQYPLATNYLPGLTGMISTYK
jgi:hypothetical protein